MNDAEDEARAQALGRFVQAAAEPLTERELALIRAEREACAKIADVVSRKARQDREAFGATYCNDIAAAIRARGQTT